MTTRLKNLRIDELSFVDHPANPKARITFCKIANPLLPTNPLLRKADDAAGAPEFTDDQAAIAEINQRRLRRRLAAERQMDRGAQGLIEENNKPDFLTEERERMSAPDHKPQNLDEVAEELQKAEKISRCAALTKARQLHPELYRSQQGGEAPVNKTTDALKAAEQGFEARVRQIQQRDGCSRLRAYTKAAREFPNERAACARGE